MSITISSSYLGLSLPSCLQLELLQKFVWISHHYNRADCMLYKPIKFRIWWEIQIRNSNIFDCLSPRETPSLFGIFYKTFAEYFHCPLCNKLFDLTSLIINIKIREKFELNNEFNVVLQSNRRDIRRILFLFHINKIQKRCNSIQAFIYCKITLHVSGVYRKHHQEYIKL